MIVTIHGVVNNFCYNQVNRSYLPKDAFVSFLKSQKRKFGSWNDSIPNGDVLTVDDSTYAAAESCYIARELGHEVILFINPRQIIEKEYYWFSILNCLIDQRTVGQIKYNDRQYDLSSYVLLSKLRKELKRNLIFRPDIEIFKELDVLKGIFGVQEMELPTHLRTLEVNDLNKLIAADVRIESHGWDHKEISTFTKDDFIDDLNRTNLWLNSELGIQTTLYAVPFGESDPEMIFGDCGIKNYFLATPDRQLGRLTNKCWNRLDITQQIKDNFL